MKKLIVLILPFLLVSCVSTLRYSNENKSTRSSELKEELNQKLQEFASYTDNLEEIFENREQIEISKFYERLPKPSLIAYEELEDGQIYHRNPLRESRKK